MNWVGGSRNRLVVKHDAKRQREFFEKKKMQNRLKKMGIAVPVSPPGTSSGSMDLVTLFMVNQIAAKKENKDPPKVAVLGSHKGGSKHKRNEPLVLPISPCSPSQLSLVESQPQYSDQGARKKKQVIPRGFKCRQLSPVHESAFSDNSASDYLPLITDPLSPFSSASSASSGKGMFPLQMNLLQRSQKQARLPPHCPPPLWDTSQLEQTEFQPFSQPRGMADSIPWSCGSNPPLYQLETPTAARVLFGRPETDNTEARDHVQHEVTFSLHLPEDREPVLDFPLNQPETEQQIEEHVFRGFSTGEGEREASHFGRGKLKIYLKDDTPVKSSTPQTVPDPQCMGVELSNYTDMNFSCLQHNNGPVNDCDCSPSYSCSRGYLSSDSNDEEECCQPCLQTAPSYMDQACCAYSQNPNLGSQGNLKQKHTQPRPLTPLPKPKMNLRDDEKVVENVARPGSDSNTAQLNSPQTPGQTHTSEPCKCKKTPNETQDAGTQTDDNPKAEMCEASTQCSFVVDSATKATDLCLPPIDVSAQHSATGRQTDTAAEPNTHIPSPGETRCGGRHTPWNKTKSRACSLSGSINPFLAERRKHENGRLIKDLSSGVRKEVTSATRVSGHSEEARTPQEIADILLLLKQREK